MHWEIQWWPQIIDKNQYKHEPYNPKTIRNSQFGIFSASNDMMGIKKYILKLEKTNILYLVAFGLSKGHEVVLKAAEGLKKGQNVSHQSFALDFIAQCTIPF